VNRGRGAIPAARVDCAHDHTSRRRARRLTLAALVNGETIAIDGDYTAQ
jgi:hypothetical protein